jgi:hypothetical protein
MDGYNDPRALRCWRMSSRLYPTSIFGRHATMRSTRVAPRCARRSIDRPTWLA